MNRWLPLLLLLWGCCSLLVVTQALCPNSCSGHGSCDDMEVCHCEDDYTLYDCSWRKCPVGKAWGRLTGVNDAHSMAECSGRGSCTHETGLCVCQSGFHGHACQFSDCPNACMAHGKCVSMQDHAQNDVVARALTDAPPLVYNTTWDFDKINGCQCDSGFGGPDCSLKTCPRGDDPLTTGQLNEVQLVQCQTSYAQQTLSLRSDAALTTGTFRLTFGTQYTRPISFQALASVDSNGVSVASALLALSGISAVSVTRVDVSPLLAQWLITFPAANAAQNAVVPKWKMIEVQQFICAADAGAFALTFANQTVLGIPYNADVNTFRTYLANSLSFYGRVDITFEYGATSLCSTSGTFVTVKFTQLWHRALVGDLPAMTFTNLNTKGVLGLFLSGGAGFIDPESREIVKGIDSCRVVEQQSFVCAATSGNFALTFGDGTLITNLAYSLSASDLRTAIMAAVTYLVDIDVSFANGLGTVCSVAGTTTTIAFVVTTNTGPNGDGDLAEVIADKTNNGANGLNHISNRLQFPSVFTEVVKGTTCVPFDQSFASAPAHQMTAPVVVGGGSFTLSFRGYTTAPIPATSTARGVRLLLEALPSIAGVSVTHSSGAQACTTPANVITLNFTQDFGNLPTVVVDGSALNVSSPGSTLSVFSSGAAATANTALVSLDGTKENDVCSNRGSCDDSKLGKCNCYTGYTNSDGYGGISTTLVRRGDCGATSRIPVGCPGDLACSGHGTCSDTPNYRCACAVGWMGGDCADRVCPSDLAWFDYPVDNNIAHQRIRECSGVGNCDRSTGLCKCPAPYTGMACELMACGGVSTECSGNGQCLSLNVLAPMVKVKGEIAGFTYGTDPNEPTTWDGWRVRSCLCDLGFLGYDCSLRECPRGDDPSTYNDVIERQIVQCVGSSGTFTLTFRDQTTVNIGYNANAPAIQAALLALSTLTQVAVAILGGATACTTDSSTVITVDFLSELGDLPSLKGSAASLRDAVNGNGLDGSGALLFATGGASLMGQASVKGTRENDFCSNHGHCDFSTGLCVCDTHYGSSDGKGGPGNIGDCGYHYYTFVVQQQS